MGENEISSQLTGLNKEDPIDKKKILLYSGLSLFLIILLIIIIIIVINKNKKNDISNKIAEFICIYDIQNKKQ